MKVSLRKSKTLLRILSGNENGLQIPLLMKNLLAKMYLMLAPKYKYRKCKFCKITFSNKKHRKYRFKLGYVWANRMVTIKEKVIEEYIESINYGDLLHYSPSEKLAHQLSSGWTLKQSFGLETRPSSKTRCDSDLHSYLPIFEETLKKLNHYALENKVSAECIHNNKTH